MNRQKKAHGTSVGTGRDTANDGQSFKGYCTTDTNYLSSPTPPDYLALMRQATTPADYLVAFTSFLSEIEVSNG